ncbi:hypothetical protein BBA71_07720 [Acetobacter pasteurianus]|nr:hypothetical protein BBA71_07720 [Acetobacter pasteurianus]
MGCPAFGQPVSVARLWCGRIFFGYTILSHAERLKRFLGFANANMAGLRLSSGGVMICAKIAQILAQDAVLLP